MAVYVYSTLSNNQLYCAYERNPQGANIMTHKVLINGGANVAKGKHIITKQGIVTKISDSDYEFLKTNQTFLDHKKKGYFEIHKIKTPIKMIVKDMKPDDESAPLTPKKCKEQKLKLFTGDPGQTNNEFSQLNSL